jgi:hypothetical protein
MIPVQNISRKAEEGRGTQESQYKTLQFLKIFFLELQFLKMLRTDLGLQEISMFQSALETFPQKNASY